MIHLPSRVVTNLDGQEIHATEGAFPTGTREVFELRTAGGYSVKLTADHKIWTRARGWVAAKDLTTADEVRLPSQAGQRPGDRRAAGRASSSNCSASMSSDTNGDLGGEARQVPGPIR